MHSASVDDDVAGFLCALCFNAKLVSRYCSLDSLIAVVLCHW